MYYIYIFSRRVHLLHMWLMYVLNQLHVGALQCVHVPGMHIYIPLVWYMYIHVATFVFLPDKNNNKK